MKILLEELVALREEMLQYGEKVQMNRRNTSSEEGSRLVGLDHEWRSTEGQGQGSFTTYTGWRKAWKWVCLGLPLHKPHSVAALEASRHSDCALEVVELY